MKIEYISEGMVWPSSPNDDFASGSPLIRLFEFDTEQVKALSAITDALAEGNLERVNLNEALGLTSIGGCTLFLVRGEHSQGVVETKSKGIFDWVLTAELWEEVSDFIYPFSFSEGCVKGRTNGWNAASVAG